MLAYVKGARGVVIDFVQALRTGEVEPLHEGLSASAMVELLGVPEADTPLASGSVCWFYGSVQMLLQEGVFQSFEIDRGLGELTSFCLRAGSWTARPRGASSCRSCNFATCDMPRAGLRNADNASAFRSGLKLYGEEPSSKSS